MNPFQIVLKSSGFNAFSATLTFAALLCLLKWLLRGGQYKKKNLATGKVVIITGSDSGIGAETARELAKRGAIVYMASCEMQKCEQVRQRIIAQTGNKRVHALDLDLSSLASVREFVASFKKAETRLDILINNAGVMGLPRMLTEEGFEMQIGVNHMGHFLLTNLLLDLLKESAPSRIVIVSSMSYILGEIKQHDLYSEKSYHPMKAYFQSKLANVLFMTELAKRLAGTNVTVNALNPGVVDTNIVRSFKSGFQIIKFYSFKTIMWPITKTPKSGAQTNIYAALDPDLDTVTGKYFSDCKTKALNKVAMNEELAKWLWEVSERDTMATYKKLE